MNIGAHPIDDCWFTTSKLRQVIRNALRLVVDHLSGHRSVYIYRYRGFDSLDLPFAQCLGASDGLENALIEVAHMKNLKRSRRRWLRFGVRSVLILTTIMAILMAYVLSPLLDHSNQQGLVKTASAMGIEIETHQSVPRDFSLARSFIGLFKPEILSAPIYEFDASNTALKDQDVEKLQGIRHVVSLDLSNTAITDKALDSITKFRRLQILKLNNTAVSDAGLKKLASISGLVDLETTGTQVSNQALLELDNTLQPWTKVSFCELRAIGELEALGFDVGLASWGMDFSGERLFHFLDSVDTANSVTCMGRFDAQAAAWLANLSSLEFVWFNRVDIEPCATEHWQKMNALTTLRINQSNLTDADLVEISRQTQLCELQIQNCDQITEVGLLPLTKLENLERLLIVGCPEVDGTTASEFRKLIPGCDVSIAGR